jgi:hypothetical protein
MPVAALGKCHATRLAPAAVCYDLAAVMLTV